MLEIKIIVGIILVIEFITGIFLNVAVLVLPPPKWSKTMVSGNKLIKSLHMVDLVICVFLMPITFAVLFLSPKVNEILCFFHESFISFTTSGGCVSVLFISLERYASIASYNRKSSRYTNVFLTIIWSISFVGFILPWINMMFRTSYFDDKNLTIVDCEYLVTSYNEYNIYEIFGLGIFFLTCFCTVFCYVGIFRVAKRRIGIKTSNDSIDTKPNIIKAQSRKKRDKRAFMVTLSLVGSFIACWVMFIIVSLLELVAPHTELMHILHLISLCLVYASTIIHPILYRFIHDDIRHPWCKRKTGIVIETTEHSGSASARLPVPKTTVTHLPVMSTSREPSTHDKTQIEIFSTNTH